MHTDVLSACVRRVRLYMCVVAETLKAAGCLAPDALLKAVDQVRHKHRSTTLCDELISHVRSLPQPHTTGH